jgi:TRAP-type C4-dicarboxylate transport system permease small subunit
MKKSLEITCGVLAGLALFAIMALTFFDVIGRKVVGHSIPGSLELTELLMVVVIFAALPLVSLRGEHVTFDSLDAHVPAAWRKLQAVLVNLSCGAVLLALAWLMWREAGQFMATGETTAQLLILKGPFIYAMSVFCALAGLVTLGLAVQPPVPLAEGEGAAL